VGLYITSYYLGGSVGATLPAPLWSAAGWHGCIILLVLVQCIAMLLIRNNWMGRALASRA
jgi:MFS transporter, YNFM family, putative membrane transport protein